MSNQQLLSISCGLLTEAIHIYSCSQSCTVASVCSVCVHDKWSYLSAIQTSYTPRLADISLAPDHLYVAIRYQVSVPQRAMAYELCHILHLFYDKVRRALIEGIADVAGLVDPLICEITRHPG